MGGRREHIVEKYAPWAITQLTTATPSWAMDAQIGQDDAGDASHHVAEDPRVVNHWVASVPTGGRLGDGEVADDDETQTCPGVYLSIVRIVIRTVVDGDCGLGVTCLMI